jgi:hypothetical protein
MSSEAEKTTIRIEGDPDCDDLIRDVKAYADSIGLKVTTAARMLIRKGLTVERERTANTREKK